MRVAFVCQVFHPDPTSTSQLFTELLRQIAGDQIHIVVLCDHPTRTEPNRQPVPRQEWFDGIEIIRCGVRIDHKAGWLSRATSYFTYIVHLSWKLLWIQKPDLLLGVTNPPFASWLLALIGRVRNIRFHYMILDMYPDGLVALGKLDRDSYLVRFWVTLNRLAYRQAERIVVLGRDMVPLLEQRYGVPAGRCTYIPHWSAVEAPPLSQPRGGRSESPRRRSEKITIQYSGNMGLWHDMETLVRAAAQLRGDDRMHFRFVGDGMRRREAELLGRELGATNISWHEFVPLDQLWDSLAACDVALISQRAGLQGIAVPCKLYGILAAGRAVIAQVPAASEVALTVEEHGCGVVVPPGDAGALADAIRSLVDSPATVREMGARARRAYLERYSMRQALAAFEALWDLPGRQIAKPARAVGAPAGQEAIEPTRFGRAGVGSSSEPLGGA